MVSGVEVLPRHQNLRLEALIEKLQKMHILVLVNILVPGIYSLTPSSPPKVWERFFNVL